MQAEKSHFGSQGEYVREKYSLSPPLNLLIYEKNI